MGGGFEWMEDEVSCFDEVEVSKLFGWNGIKLNELWLMTQW
jgi:hypothetical protein